MLLFYYIDIYRIYRINKIAIINIFNNLVCRKSLNLRGSQLTSYVFINMYDLDREYILFIFILKRRLSATFIKKMFYVSNLGHYQ